ncbi:MAG: CoA transferase [Wenzhouxiangellaceae bacterium]
MNANTDAITAIWGPQSDQGDGPLAGLRVLDLTSVILGAYATQMLGDMGAAVIKVEAPAPDTGLDGDIMRWGGRQPANSAPGMGPLFLNYNRNKRSLMLDLKDAQSQQYIHQLVAQADVLVSIIRPAAMRRLRLDYATVSGIKPDIVYAQAVGFGSDGPYAGLPAYDDLIQAASGGADLLPRTSGEDEPRYLPSLIADKTVGLYLLNAILAAVIQRQQSGQGQYVEVPMLECFTHFTMGENLYGHTYQPPTQDYGYPRVLNPDRRPYRTADGYLAVVPYSDEQWQAFFSLGGQPQLALDPRFRDYRSRTRHIVELYALIEPMLRQRTTGEWLRLLHEAGIPAMPVNRLHQVADDPHLKAVGFFDQGDKAGLGRYQQLRHPVHFQRTPADLQRAPPLPGEHTEEILKALHPDKNG